MRFTILHTWEVRTALPVCAARLRSLEPYQRHYRIRGTVQDLGYDTYGFRFTTSPVHSGWWVLLLYAIEVEGILEAVDVFNTRWQARAYLKWHEEGVMLVGILLLVNGCLLATGFPPILFLLLTVILLLPMGLSLWRAQKYQAHILALLVESNAPTMVEEDVPKNTGFF